MTDQNPCAADSPLTSEQFDEAMNKALFDGPVMMDYDDAQAVYAQCLHFAAQHLNDAEYCKALIALSEVFMHKEEFDKAIPLIKLALEVCEQYLPPLHERVGAMHYLLAAAYQFNAEYDLACEHWIAVIRCFDWLPLQTPVLREAAEELFYCRSRKCGMSDSEFYLRDAQWRDAA